MILFLPPLASLMTTVYCEGAAPDVDAIVESDQRLLLDRGVSVARGIAWLKERKFQVLLTNFTEEYKHLNKGAAIGFLEEAQKAGDVIAVTDFERAPEETFKLPHTFDVNPAHPQERNKLLALFYRCSESSSSNSKLRQTPLAKHRKITKDGVRRARQSP